MYLHKLMSLSFIEPKHKTMEINNIAHFYSFSTTKKSQFQNIFSKLCLSLVRLINYAGAYISAIDYFQLFSLLYRDTYFLGTT